MGQATNQGLNVNKKACCNTLATNLVISPKIAKWEGGDQVFNKINK